MPNAENKMDKKFEKTDILYDLPKMSLCIFVFLFIVENFQRYNYRAYLDI